jgi:predicted amidohydrolase
MKLRIAAARHLVGEPHDFAAFAGGIEAEVSVATEAGAQVVVLPEYLALEAAAMLPAATRGDFARSLAALQVHHADYLALASGLARRHGIDLVAGTFLLDVGGRYRNRAWLAGPDGATAWQDTLVLTGFERASGIIEPGDQLKVFDTAFGRLAIQICYDIEFPLHARNQVEAGARLVLVPSCTDTEAGATRVRVGCQARALENQVHVACAVTAGEAHWSPALDVNTGDAAICTPIDAGFPADGIAARAGAGQTWAIADIDLDAMDALRREGQVANADDWKRQLRPSLARARVEKV